MATPQAEHCNVEGCKREYRSKGFCALHFKKWRRGEMPKKGRYKTCVEEGCRKPRGRDGLCATHFAALRGKAAPAQSPAAAAVAAEVATEVAAAPAAETTV